MRTSQGSVRLRTPRTVENVDLENRIANFLCQQHVPHSERIHTDAQVGTVVVSGKLPSRHAKWLCVECCRRVAGVVKLVDHVAVSPSLPVTDGSSS